MKLTSRGSYIDIEMRVSILKRLHVDRSYIYIETLRTSKVHTICILNYPVMGNGDILHRCIYITSISATRADLYMCDTMFPGAIYVPICQMTNFIVVNRQRRKVDCLFSS